MKGDDVEIALPEIVVKDDHDAGAGELNGVGDGHVEMKKSVGKATLSWQDCGYTITTKKQRKKPAETKVILEGLNGTAKPGEMMAILGTSGAGKTTFLNVLSGRVHGTVHGSVRVNGVLRDKSFSKMSAYVCQDDLLFALLTVRETFEYAARLRLPRSVSLEDKKRRAEEVIKELGLTHCADTRVGGQIVRGVSGGERKRVAIGQTLIVDPRILFLDEPTSGLDSYTASFLVETLRDLARRDRTVICTIHQPRAKVFHMFDKLLLLSKGRTCYYGPVHSALNYFSDLGFTCPPSTNIADYLLDITTVDTRTDALKERSMTAVRHFHEQYEESQMSEDALQTMNAIHDRKKSLANGMKVAPEEAPHREGWPNRWFEEFMILYSRAFRMYTRNKATTVVAAVQQIIFGLLAGLIWLNAGRSHNQNSIQNRVGLIFFAILNQSFGNLLPVVQTFHLERVIFLRERASSAYRVSTYYLGKTLSEMPFQVIMPCIYSVVVYWMVGLRPGADAFFTFMVVIVVTIFCAQSLGYFLGCVTPSLPVAMAIAPMCLILLLLFSGFYLNVESLPDFLFYLKYVSFIYYGFRALCYNEFNGETFECTPEEAARGRCQTTGADVLASLDMADVNVWRNVGILVSMGIILRIMAWLALRYLYRPKTNLSFTNEPMPEELTAKVRQGHTEAVDMKLVAQAAGEWSGHDDVEGLGVRGEGEEDKVSVLEMAGDMVRSTFHAYMDSSSMMPSHVVRRSLVPRRDSQYHSSL